jgi:hypothetical protein
MDKGQKPRNSLSQLPLVDEALLAGILVCALREAASVPRSLDGHQVY